MFGFLYPRLLRPAFFLLPAETAHELALDFLRILSFHPSLLRLLFGLPPRKPTSLCGMEFPNPVGLAAGMDKNASALAAWEFLGFGFVEIGTITAHAQPGNPKPRLFRYPENQALVNRMGFNNDGCEAIAQRLASLRGSGRWPKIPVGINLGKSKITPLGQAAADYRISFEKLYDFADYFVVNVSSPNTPGLRTLQAASELAKILSELRAVETSTRKPIWVKLAPDLSEEELKAAADVTLNYGADAIIVTNTTLDHSALSPAEDQAGGLSGAPLRNKALRVQQLLHHYSPLPLIASGGIMSGEDASQRIAHGAILIQVYTGFVYKGPGLLREICERIDLR